MPLNLEFYIRDHSLKHTEYRNILHYFPGLVILIFGMLALHSTVTLIKDRKDISFGGLTVLSDVVDVHSAFEDLTLNYEHFLLTKNEEGFDLIKKDLDTLNDRFDVLWHDALIVESIDGFPKAEYKRAFYDIKSKIDAIFSILIKIEKTEYESTERKRLETDFYVLQTELYEHIVLLQHLLLSHLKDKVSDRKAHKNEQWLYWSVIAMGLSGFILIILNADRLRQLNESHLEKKKAYDVLQNRLAALEQAHDGIIILSSENNIVYCNKSFCTMVHTAFDAREELFGQPWDVVFSGNEFEILDKDVLPVLAENPYWVGDFPIIRDDLPVRYTELSLTKLPDGGMVGTLQDVSDKKQADDEKKTLEDQFYQAQKMEAIGRLAGGIAHDFNNILAAMNGYAEFLIDDLDDASEQHRFAHNILQAGKQARSLVDQMLAFSRRDSGNVRESVDIIPSLQETIDMLHATLPKTVEMSYQCNVNEAKIHGNATQIAQLIMNLCVNALDAMDDEHGRLNISLDLVSAHDIGISNVIKDALPDTQGTPYLRIDPVGDDRTFLLLNHVSRFENYVRLSIADTGCGMDSSVMEHVFEPFFTTKDVDKGTGLGLATVHGVVVSHQSFLCVESTVGQGTSFHIYFPIVTGAQIECISDSNAQVAVKKDKDDEAVGYILLVEDQESVRDMMQRMLERAGYHITTATTAVDAIDMIREKPTFFDLVVTDYNMPHMTGFEMIEDICVDFPDLQFIVVSGYSEEKIYKRISGHASVYGILRKPVAKDVLLKKIKGCLPKSA